MAELVGNFNGNSFTGTDPETGFLTQLNNRNKPERADVSLGLDVKDVRQDVDVKDVVRRDGSGRFLAGVGSGYYPVPVFNVQKKLEVLNRLWDLWPDVSTACRLSGVSRQTFNSHLAVDKSFRECIDEIQDKAVDAIEGFRFRMAQTSGGALDRMAVLNAYRQERYNPKTEIEVKHTMTRDEALDSHRRMEQAVDAEVVETVQRIKARSRGQIAPKTQQG